MNIRLNGKTVTDEILAISALRCMTSQSGRQLITRDMLPGLRVVMRMVFAELTLRLSGWLEECATDNADTEAARPYDQGETPLMELTLKPMVNAAGGLAMVVKRQLEHLVAAGTLGWVAADGDTMLAMELQKVREDGLDKLTAQLEEAATGAAPFRREGWEW